MRARFLSVHNAAAIDLPLVVPSFSSKGFGYFTDPNSGERRSETSVTLELTGGFLQESFLVSAYDLFHRHYANPAPYFKDTAVVFIDSGGYELNPDFDSTEPRMTSVLDLKFSLDDYIHVLQLLKDEDSCYPLLIANYDWKTKGKPFSEQIRAARKQFRMFPSWATNFILKPDTPDSGVVHAKRVAQIANELRSFDVIGVTEKELGKGLMDRLKRLAKLRLTLWDNGIEAPIHVWGGMDPLTTPLYFFAGADIFDGVSWLRYAYTDGLAVTINSGPILRGELLAPHEHSLAITRSRNLTALQELAVNMRFFANQETPDFTIFGPQEATLKRAYEVLGTKIGNRFEELR